MAKPLAIKVKETAVQLRSLQKKHPSKFKPLQMLVILFEQGPLSQKALAAMIGSSDKSINKWRKEYMSGGVALLLEEHRGGHKEAKITPEAEKQLRARLNNPKEGFRSYIEILQWLLDEFGIEMNYHAINKYVKRNYGARLKVSRKSHVQKSPADEAVFKKPSRKI